MTSFQALRDASSEYWLRDDELEERKPLATSSKTDSSKSPPCPICRRHRRNCNGTAPDCLNYKSAHVNSRDHPQRSLAPAKDHVTNGFEFEVVQERQESDHLRHRASFGVINNLNSASIGQPPTFKARLVTGPARFVGGAMSLDAYSMFLQTDEKPRERSRDILQSRVEERQKPFAATVDNATPGTVAIQLSDSPDISSLSHQASLAAEGVEEVLTESLMASKRQEEVLPKSLNLSRKHRPERQEEVLPESLKISREDTPSTQNATLSYITVMQTYVEHITGTQWDWWPLPSPRIQDGLPAESDHPWSPTLCNDAGAETDLAPSSGTTSRQFIIDMTSLEEGKSSSLSSSQPGSTTPDSNRSDSMSGSTEVGSNASNPDLECQSPRFVFMAVKNGEAHLLAQIEVQNATDMTFFRDLRHQDRERKGRMRRSLSVWKYAHCIFMKLERIAPVVYVIHPSEPPLPPETDKSYLFTRCANEKSPPITPYEFRCRFYKDIRDPEIEIGALGDKSFIPPSHALQRIAKRDSRISEHTWDREEFWGLLAVDEISFIMVAFYHFLLLVPAMAFWIYWMASGHATDLQNASVPFLAAIGCLSLFWFPLIQR